MMTRLGEVAASGSEEVKGKPPERICMLFLHLLLVFMLSYANQLLPVAVHQLDRHESVTLVELFTHPTGAEFKKYFWKTQTGFTELCGWKKVERFTWHT